MCCAAICRSSARVRTHWAAAANNKFFWEVDRKLLQRHCPQTGRLTGLAQVRGHRGTTEFEKGISPTGCNPISNYIANWSLGLRDIEIVLKTVMVLKHDNAYLTAAVYGWPFAPLRDVEGAGYPAIRRSAVTDASSTAVNRRQSALQIRFTQPPAIERVAAPAQTDVARPW